MVLYSRHALGCLCLPLKERDVSRPHMYELRDSYRFTSNIKGSAILQILETKIIKIHCKEVPVKHMYHFVVV